MRQNCGDTRGRRHRGRNPGESGTCSCQEKPAADAPAARRPKSSREARGPRVKKSRYRSHRTRTADRHRWMGRGSQGRRKKYCQGTRQNDPVTSGEGVPVETRAAENRPKQLFSKNTGLCKAARRRIWADACPVLEGYEEGLAARRSSESKPQ